MSIKLENLRYFCTVVQSGNLADAAERLGRTQSALSISLKQLETHLDVNLFDGERKNALSPAGEQIYALAQHQLREFDQTIQSMKTHAKATGGLIRIASVPSIAAIVFPNLLNTLSELHPGINVELRDTDTSQVLDALLNAKTDIGIASGHHAINGVVGSALLNDRFGLVCASDHPLMRQRKSPTISDVVTHAFIRHSLCNLITTPEFVNALDHTNITVHNNHSLINILSSGSWVSVLPESVCEYLPDTVSFRYIKDLPDRREVWLYYREQSRYQELIATSCDFIRDFIKYGL